MESAERIQFIAEYLSSYQTKIEALNKNGLFDSATLFEVFACETCAIWFGQKFSNLNTNSSTFPYVDLVSEDGLIYVQVSTAQDIPAKVKTTLTKIKDKKSSKISNVRTLFFFVLGNQSIDHLPDYSGKNAIGSIEFKKDEHLITVEKIIARAKVEISFYILCINFILVICSQK